MTAHCANVLQVSSHVIDESFAEAHDACMGWNPESKEAEVVFIAP